METGIVGFIREGNLYRWAIPAPNSSLTSQANFAVRARLVLAASKAPLIVALAGLRLAPQDVEIVRTRSPENLLLGEQLLRKAQHLAPADPQWGMYFNDPLIAGQPRQDEI